MKELKEFVSFKIMETDTTVEPLKLRVRPPTLVERFEAFKLFLRVLSGHKEDKYYQSMKFGRTKIESRGGTGVRGTGDFVGGEYEDE